MYANYIQSRFIVLGDNDADHSVWLKKKVALWPFWRKWQVLHNHDISLTEQLGMILMRSPIWWRFLFCIDKIPSCFGDVTLHIATTQRHVKCHALSTIAPIREQMPSFSIKLSHGAFRGSYCGIVVVQQVPEYSYIIPFFVCLICVTINRTLHNVSVECIWLQLLSD